MIPKILEKFMVSQGVKVQSYEFFRIEFLELMFAWKKINPEKHVFEVKKRKLAPKIVKKFSEVYFFTIIDHTFFRIFRINVLL